MAGGTEGEDERQIRSRGSAAARSGRDPAVVIRPLRRRDLPAFVELWTHQWPDDLTTPASEAWRLDHPVRGEHGRRRVATEGARVVGWAIAGRSTWTAGRVGCAYVGVRPERRERGIGRLLWEVAERHLERLAVTRTNSGSKVSDEAAARFVEARGFRPTRRDQAWSVDPRAVATTGLPERLRAAPAAGLRLVPVRDLLDRPEDLYRLELALEGDLPSDLPIGQSYQAWRVHDFDTPLFAPDASFCVLDGDDPVAVTWIYLDEARHRAGHGMTGTLPAYRHRGLARLVKLASIRWLSEHGVTTLFTDNDTENGDMLTLNEHLGFRPLIQYQLWARGA